MNIEIKSRFRGDVLFAHDAEENSVKITLEAAVKVMADLAGAYLAGANLDGAYLARANLAGERPVFQIGPIGSRCAYLIAYLTDKGIFVRAGCFFGTRDEFLEKVKETHGENAHAREYLAAVAFIDAHAAIWGNKN